MTDKELIKIWRRCEETRRNNVEAETIFEGLSSDEKLRIFDLIKGGEHLR